MAQAAQRGDNLPVNGVGHTHTHGQDPDGHEKRSGASPSPSEALSFGDRLSLGLRLLIEKIRDGKLSPPTMGKKRRKRYPQILSDKKWTLLVGEHFLFWCSRPRPPELQQRQRQVVYLSCLWRGPCFKAYDAPSHRLEARLSAVARPWV